MVHTLQNTETDLYRIILFASSGEELLVFPENRRVLLPTLRVPRHQRPAANLTSSLRSDWLQEAVCLFSFDSNQPAAGLQYQVMQSCNENPLDTPGSHWAPISSLEQDQFAESSDYAAIVRAHAECQEYAAGCQHGPFGKLGWFSELTEWAGDQVRREGRTLNGKFRQLDSGPTFSLCRFETDGPAVWFKATGEPNVREFSITVALSRLFPESLPPLLGVRPSWNGWLSVEVSGATLGQFTELSVWERVAGSLAELQISSIGNDAELLGAGCKDLRPSNLVGFIDPFFSCMSEFMTQQQKQSPPPLRDSELSFLVGRLKEACAVLHDLQFPDTLGHTDLNPGNILICPESCRFLDWAEGCVATPLASLEYLMEHLRRSPVEDVAGCERLAAAYLRPWHLLFSREDLSRAKEWSPLISVFAHAVACDPWRPRNAPEKEFPTGYFRSLARRMHREAIRLTGSTEQRVPPPSNRRCLSSSPSLYDC